MKETGPLSKTDLRKLYPDPKEVVRNAYAPGLDETSQRFIKATSLLLLSSTNSEGYIDITPRGGPPGFITVRDNRHIAFLNEMGNNKILTLSNLSENQQVGLMFVVPGQVEIVRAYGNAIASSDEGFIRSLGGDLKRNKTAIQIEIIKVFPHCSTAINRAGLWKQDEWPDKEAFNIPGLMEMAEGLATYRLQLETNPEH